MHDKFSKKWQLHWRWKKLSDKNALAAREMYFLWESGAWDRLPLKERMKFASSNPLAWLRRNDKKCQEKVKMHLRAKAKARYYFEELFMSKETNLSQTQSNVVSESHVVSKSQNSAIAAGILEQLQTPLLTTADVTKANATILLPAPVMERLHRVKENFVTITTLYDACGLGTVVCNVDSCLTQLPPISDVELLEYQHLLAQNLVNVSNKLRSLTSYDLRNCFAKTGNTEREYPDFVVKTARLANAALNLSKNCSFGLTSSAFKEAARNFLAHNENFANTIEHSSSPKINVDEKIPEVVLTNTENITQGESAQHISGQVVTEEKAIATEIVTAHGSPGRLDISTPRHNILKVAASDYLSTETGFSFLNLATAVDTLHRNHLPDSSTLRDVNYYFRLPVTPVLRLCVGVNAVANTRNALEGFHNAATAMDYVDASVSTVGAAAGWLDFGSFFFSPKNVLNGTSKMVAGVNASTFFGGVIRHPMAAFVDLYRAGKILIRDVPSIYKSKKAAQALQAGLITSKDTISEEDKSILLNMSANANDINSMKARSAFMDTLSSVFGLCVRASWLLTAFLPYFNSLPIYVVEAANYIAPIVTFIYVPICCFSKKTMLNSVKHEQINRVYGVDQCIDHLMEKFAKEGLLYKDAKSIVMEYLGTTTGKRGELQKKLAIESASALDRVSEEAADLRKLSFKSLGLSENAKQADVVAALGVAMGKNETPIDALKKYQEEQCAKIHRRCPSELLKRIEPQYNVTFDRLDQYVNSPVEKSAVTK